MTRLKKLATLTKESKLSKKKFIETVLQNGYITIDQGQYFFVVTQINKENFPDMDEKLEEQLNNEGKYNGWIGFIDNNSQAPFSVQALPIYGSYQSFITEYVKYTAEGAAEYDLSDRQMQLLKRANEYLENNK